MSLEQVMSIDQAHRLGFVYNVAGAFHCTDCGRMIRSFDEMLGCKCSMVRYTKDAVASVRRVKRYECVDCGFKTRAARVQPCPVCLGEMRGCRRG